MCNICKLHDQIIELEERISRFAQYAHDVYGEPEEIEAKLEQLREHRNLWRTFAKVTAYSAVTHHNDPPMPKDVLPWENP